MGYLAGAVVFGSIIGIAVFLAKKYPPNNSCGKTQKAAADSTATPELPVLLTDTKPSPKKEAPVHPQKDPAPIMNLRGWSRKKGALETTSITRIFSPTAQSGTLYS